MFEVKEPPRIKPRSTRLRDGWNESSHPSCASVWCAVVSKLCSGWAEELISHVLTSSESTMSGPLM